MWGLKMQVLRLPKVPAVGQTSGSSEWVKKLAFVLTKAMGLSSVGSNPKNNKEIALLPLEMFRGGKCGSHFLVMVFPRKDRILRILSVRKKCVVHTNENFWLILLQDRPITLDKYSYK